MNRQAFARRKPLVKIFRVQDHRLAIMKFPHDAIRLARKRRERLFPFLCFRISPFYPDSRYPEELAIENFDLTDDAETELRAVNERGALQHRDKFFYGVESLPARPVA